MGNTDSLPVVSQVKSVVQVIAGDRDGAEETQKNFFKGCPVLSQGLALGAAVTGHTKYAKESQLYFINNLSNMADSMPVVGHVKGAIHYACGDKEGGANAMKAATRTVGVAAGGIGGIVVAGPAGAIVGGISGGAAMDGIISVTSKTDSGEKQLFGHFQSLDRALRGKMTAGEAFDWFVTPVFDGLSGLGYGKAYKNFTMNRAEYRQLKKKITQAIKEGKFELKEGQTAASLAKELQTAARDLKAKVSMAGQDKVIGTTGSKIIDVDGNAHTGYSFRLRDALQMDAFEDGITSVEQILNEKHPGKSIGIRGVGEPSCAEPHALNEFHKANGHQAVPKLSITVQFDGTDIVAKPRCSSCKKVGNSVSMGQVLTDSIDGVPIPVDQILNKACLDTLLAECMDICDCDNPHEENE